MTYSFRNVIGIVNLSKGKGVPKGLVFDYDHWPYLARKLYDYVCPHLTSYSQLFTLSHTTHDCFDKAIGCHYSHLLDFSVALICYLFVFPSTFAEATEIRVGWISKVRVAKRKDDKRIVVTEKQIIAFNLVVEFLLYGFWHHMLYASKGYAPHVKPAKFNPTNQYQKKKKGRCINEKNLLITADMRYPSQWDISAPVVVSYKEKFCLLLWDFSCHLCIKL